MKKIIHRREFINQASMIAAGILISPLFDRGLKEDRKLGVALVGLGRYSANQLAPALKQTQYCKLTGVVTGSREKGERWAKDHGFSAKNIYGYDNMHELADNKEIDIIYVVTPNGLHAEHSIAAAKAGKHVICEKPMANTVAECDAIIKACKDARVKLSIGYRLYFDPYHRELMRLAKEKDFGEFKTMTGRRAFSLNNKTWRADKKLAGGGPLMDLGVYLVQAACMAANNQAPLSVTAKENVKTKPEIFAEVEEGIDWTMEFPGGAVCNSSTSYQGSGDRFRAEGEKGWIEFKQQAFTYNGCVVETSRGSLDYAYPNQQALQMDDFAQCILQNRTTPVPGEMGRRDLVIMEAIYKAAANGKKIEVKV
jgi:glucose-fructose oxidoreductase